MSKWVCGEESPSWLKAQWNGGEKSPSRLKAVCSASRLKAVCSAHSLATKVPPLLSSLFHPSFTQAHCIENICRIDQVKEEEEEGRWRKGKNPLLGWSGNVLMYSRIPGGVMERFHL